MAPEQIEGREVDARSDLFSFGAVLFEMLTGDARSTATDAADVRAAILGARTASVSSLQPSLPPAIDAIVRRCLAKDRDERWQSAADIVRELNQVLAGTARGETGSPAAIRRERDPHHLWTWVGAVLVAAS